MALPRSRSRGARTVAAALVASAWLGVSLTTPQAAPGQTRTTVPTTTISTDNTLALAEQSPWVTPDGSFSVRLTIPASAPNSTPTLTLRVGDRVLNRSEFNLQLDFGADFDRPVRGSAAFSPDQLTRTGSEIAVEIPVGTLALTQAGVYPITVSASWPQRTMSLLTFVTVVEPNAAPIPLSVAMVIPIHLPTNEAAVSSVEGRRIASLADEIARQTAVPLTLAPTPETLARLTTTRTDATRSALAALQRAARQHPTLLRPYVPLDPGALGRAGLVEILTEAWNSGREAVENQLGVKPIDTVWLAEASASGGELDPTGVELLRGLELARPLQFVVSSKLVTPTDRFSPTHLLELGDIHDPNSQRPESSPALIADDGLADYLKLTPDPVLGAYWALAGLSVLWEETPSVPRSVALVPHRQTPLAPAALRVLTDALASNPLVRPLDLQVALASTPAVEGTLNGFHDRRGEAGLSLVNAASTDVAAARSTLTQVGVARARLDSAFFNTVSSDLASAEGRLRATQRLQREVASLTSDVLELPGPRTVRLTARQGELPLTIRNTSDHPIQVRVGLATTKVDVTASAPLRYVLQPGTSTISIPVRSRGNGSFSLPVRLLSPTGSLELGTTRFTVHPTGTAGGGVGGYAAFAGLIALWWARWTRHHRAGRTEASAEPPAEPDHASQSSPT